MSSLRPARSMILALLVGVSLASGSAPAQPLRRFALFVGNDDGGPGTRPLLYARDDARRLHDVFLRLGGVQAEDAMLLLDENADDVSTALGELERRARDARARGDRTALIFYFSGHAKEGALRLGSTKLALESVKARLAQGAADVRVGLFDACRSGAVTRTKGVRRAPSFEVETDATRAARGLVILTSSASDEDSQESDVIGASYFSYHLATGLLGSADQTGDGRVTLSEAYAYAYERTLAATAESAGGPQHPTFSFDLAGNGDLVLTDLLERREGLRLPAAAPAGTYYIVDARGVVLAEAVKSDRERLIALPPGRYTLKRRLVDHLRVGHVEIVPGQIAEVDEASFRRNSFSEDPVKGTGLTATFSRHWSLSVAGNYQAVFDQPTQAGGYFPSAPLLGVEASMHNFFGRGFSLSGDLLYGWTQGSVTTPMLDSLPYRYSIVSAGVALAYEWGQEGRFVPLGGVHLALDFMSRSFTTVSLPAQTYSVLTPGIFVGLKVRLTGSFSLIARARVHYLLYNIDETKSLGTADLGALLDYELK